MTTVKKITDENDQLVKETYQDIRDTRNTQYIGNFWKYLAFDPSLLKEVWTDVKNVMTKETLIDKKTKEMIYMAVSITNNCNYCTHSHTAASTLAKKNAGESTPSGSGPRGLISYGSFPA